MNSEDEGYLFSGYSQPTQRHLDKKTPHATAWQHLLEGLAGYHRSNNSSYSWAGGCVGERPRGVLLYSETFFLCLSETVMKP